MRFLKLSTLATALGVYSVNAQHADPIAAAQADGYALGVAVSKRNQPPEFHVSGTIHKGSKDEVSAHAAWHIGSITKSFTATLVLQKVDRGLLRLDAPIASYLPNDADGMHASVRALTLRQLLSHTSGLPANAGIMAMRQRGNEDLHVVRQRVLSGIWDSPVEPGEYRYSNIGYVLAGYIVETVTVMTWEDLVQQEIAKPLGLASLGFGASTEPGAAWGHRNWFVITLPVSPTSKGADNPPWLGPAGTLHLNLADLITWGETHLAACRGELADFLSAASCREMQTVVEDGYGLGWIVNPDQRIWHNGSNTMWYAVLSMNPSTDTVIAAAANVLDMPRIQTLVDQLEAQ